MNQCLVFIDHDQKIYAVLPVAEFITPKFDQTRSLQVIHEADQIVRPPMDHMLEVIKKYQKDLAGYREASSIKEIFYD